MRNRTGSQRAVQNTRRYGIFHEPLSNKQLTFIDIIFCKFELSQNEQLLREQRRQAVKQKFQMFASNPQYREHYMARLHALKTGGRPSMPPNYQPKPVCPKAVLVHHVARTGPAPPAGEYPGSPNYFSGRLRQNVSYEERNQNAWYQDTTKANVSCEARIPNQTVVGNGAYETHPVSAKHQATHDSEWNYVCIERVYSNALRE